MITVSIVFARRNKPMPLSRLIMFAEGLSFSHSAILVESEFGKDIYESVTPKSKKTSFYDWQKTYTIQYKVSFHVKDEQMQKDIFAWLELNMGHPYSLSQLLFIGLGMLFNPFSLIFKDAKWNGSRFLICTELTGNFIERFLGYKFNKSTESLKLKEVLDVAKMLGGKK